MKKAKREKKAATEESTAMGEALKKAGVKVEETDGDAKIKVVKKTAYEVHFRYEAENGKSMGSSTVVLDCENAQDAQAVVRYEIQKRGLNPEQIDFISTEPAPDKQAEVAVEASFPEPAPGKTGEMFPEDAAQEEPGYRCVEFVGKLGDMTVKNGRLQSVTLKIDIFGENCVELSAHLVKLFKKREDVHFTAIPFQMTINDLQRNKRDADSAPTETIPTKSIGDGEKKTEDDNATDMFVCPHCQMTLDIPRKDRPKDIKCESCGKEFPVDFDTPIPEQDDALFENGNGKKPSEQEGE